MTATALSAESAPFDPVAMLAELARIGMRVAAELERRICDAEESEEKVGTDTAGLALERVSRSVQLALMLREKFKAAAREPVEDRPALVKARKETLERTTGRVAEAEGKSAGLYRMYARERLSLDDIYGDVLKRPVSEVLALLCKDLDLSPDWPKLAHEAWAQDEIGSDGVGWPLAALAPPPDPPPKALPLDGEGLGWGGGTPPPKEPLRAV